MSSERGKLTFWEGLSGEFKGNPLQGVFFVGLLNEHDIGCTYEVSDHYGSFELEDKLPSDQEMRELIATGQVVKLSRPGANDFKRVYKILVGNVRDDVHEPFTIDGVNYGYMAREYESLPWSRIPCERESIWVAGEASLVDDILFHLDGQVEIVVKFESQASDALKVAALQAQGFIPIDPEEG